MGQEKAWIYLEQLQRSQGLRIPAPFNSPISLLSAGLNAAMLIREADAPWGDEVVMVQAPDGAVFVRPDPPVQEGPVRRRDGEILYPENYYLA